MYTITEQQKEMLKSAFNLEVPVSVDIEFMMSILPRTIEYKEETFYFHIFATDGHNWTVGYLSGDMNDFPCLPITKPELLQALYCYYTWAKTNDVL